MHHLGFHILADSATALAAVLLIYAWAVQGRVGRERAALV